MLGQRSRSLASGPFRFGSNFAILYSFSFSVRKLLRLSSARPIYSFGLGKRSRSFWQFERTPTISFIIFVMMYLDLLITMSVKTKLGPTYFTSYFRSQVKVICKRTPTIFLKISLLIKIELLVTMLIISKLGPPYFASYEGSKVEVNTCMRCNCRVLNINLELWYSITKADDAVAGCMWAWIIKFSAFYIHSYGDRAHCHIFLTIYVAVGYSVLC